MNQKLHSEPPPIKVPPVGTHKHEDALLDEAVAESMIASDPISPAAQSLMEPVGTAPSTTRQRTAGHTPGSMLWVFVAGTALAYLALLAFRRGTS